MDIFFTADTHFGHDNIRKYCKRPFRNIVEMDNALINNWNATVSNSDFVYHLGDFAFGSSQQIKSYLSKLNGQIIFIEGNHDRVLGDYLRSTGQKLHKNYMLKWENYGFFLSHYAHRVWNKSHYNIFHCYGHSHGQLPDYGLSTDVGVDAHNYKPVSIQFVIDRMELKIKEME